MHECIYQYFFRIRCVKTKGCQRVMAALEYMILHRSSKGHASPYRAVAEIRGEKYNTVARSIARTTETIWKKDMNLSRGSKAPAPSPLWVLGELIFQITGEKYM